MKINVQDFLARHGLASEFAQQAIAAFIIKLGGAVLSFVMFVAIAREMNAVTYGHFSILINLSILVSAIFGLGTSFAVLRFWPRYMATEDYAKARGFIHFCFWLIGISSIVLLLIAEFANLSWSWSSLLGFQHAPLAIAALAICFTVADFVASALRSQNSIYWSMLPRDIIWRSATPLIIFILSANAIRIDEFIVSNVTIIVLSILLAVQCWVLWINSKSVTKHTPPEMEISEWRGPMMALWGSTVVFAIVQQFDVVIVGALAGPAEAGAYFAAQKIASVLGLVLLAAGLVAAPAISRLFHGQHLADLQLLCSRLVVVVAFATLAGFALVVLFGNQLLKLFDADYVHAYGALVILALATVFDSLCGPTAALMQMTKLESAYLKLIAAVYALVIAAQLALVPSYGIMAAALCNLAGVIVWNLAAIVKLRKQVGVDPSITGVMRSLKQHAS
jgi:O-antigen/teichoic acid export membrane protein